MREFYPLLVQGVKFQKETSSQPRVIKLNSKGRRGGIACFQGNQESLDTMEQVFSYVFAGKHADVFSFVNLYLVDQDGNHWVVERKQGYLRYYKNRQKVAASEELAVFRSIFGCEFDSNREMLAVTPLAIRGEV